MSCCNGDCVGSVTLAQGPAGATGPTGPAGGVGLTGPQGPAGPAGPEELVIESSQTHVATTSNTYQTAFTVPIDATALDFGDVDDVLRVEFDLVGDWLNNPDFTTTITELYHWKLSLGGTVIFDTVTSIVALYTTLLADVAAVRNAGRMTMDLRMTVANTEITPVVSSNTGVGGIIADEGTVLTKEGLFGVNSISKLSPVTITDLSAGSQDLVLEIKTVDGTVNNITMTNFIVKKFLKV